MTTVIYAMPFLIPFTTPFELTVAIALLLDFQVAFLLLALDGLMVGINLKVLPLVMNREVLLSLTDATGWMTVTLQVAFFAPLTVVTVIVAVPGPFAVIFPVDDTVAILVLLEVHLIVLLAAFAGRIVTDN